MRQADAQQLMSDVEQLFLAMSCVSQMLIRVIDAKRWGGYLLGDSEYDSNPLFDLAHEAGHLLVVQKRQKHQPVGHRRQSLPVGAASTSARQRLHNVG